MSQVVISSNLTQHVVVIRAYLTVALLHQISDAFTPAIESESIFHQVLSETFGEHWFRRYCFDMSDTIFRITFSDKEEPKVLSFQGKPACIAPSDAAQLKLGVQQVDFIKPETYEVEDHPYYINI